MRLIDADLLKSSDEMAKVFNNLSNEMYGMLQLIDEQPTAFDSERVLEQIEFNKELINMARVNEREKNCIVNTWNMARTLVKGGGVDE